MRFKYQVTFLSGRAESNFDSLREAVNYAMSCVGCSEWFIWETIMDSKPKLVMHFSFWGIEK